MCEKAEGVSQVFVFFFFQAEDGIRDDLVTGVQTCALPICPQGFVLLFVRKMEYAVIIYPVFDQVGK